MKNKAFIASLGFAIFNRRTVKVADGAFSGQDLKDVLDTLKAAPDAGVVRELMLALQFVTAACEFADGKRKKDDTMLSRAMSVGITISYKYKHLLPDYMQDSYWTEVGNLPERVGLPPLKGTT